MQTQENKNTTAMIIASQNQDYVDEGLAEYQDQIHKLQSKSCIGYKYRKPASLVFKQNDYGNTRFTFI